MDLFIPAVNIENNNEKKRCSNDIAAEKLYMVIQSRELERVLDFILNRATEADLNAMEMAMKRRGKSGLDSIAALDFGKMAKEMVQGFGEQFGVGADAHAMTRRLVTSMILERVPEISVEELELLLDEWVPGPNAVKRGKENKLPPDAIYSMVNQFVDYSLGKMPQKELLELKKSMPDWTSRYWDIFSQDTKFMIKDLLDGKIDLHLFRVKLARYLGIEK